ncbi:MAG: amidohydrolase family protein [Acidimicrobiia bacterium]|nr:amidohydrolase family protein [Acidimicrobiia bacterium]
MAAPGGSAGESGGKTPVIDIHCHRECAAAGEMMSAESERLGRIPLSFGSELTKEVNRRQLSTIRPMMESVDVRLAAMDKAGVDIQALSVSPYQMFYWAEPEVGLKSSRMVNDDLAELVATHPDRFMGLGTVPLQDTEAAVGELDRCVNELGFRGLEIATNVEGEELSSTRLEPFWAAVEEHGVVVFIHPTGFTQPDRLDHHYFFNVVGHPIENTLAIANLIFGGVIERHPDLKIVVAHGGGYLPAYAGRMDHAYHAREDVREGLPKPPGEYLKKFHFDTMVFEPDQVGFLVEKYGASQVILGTDYPYDMGEEDPVGLVKRTAGLDDSQRDLICGGNAARLLGLA